MIRRGSNGVARQWWCGEVVVGVGVFGEVLWCLSVKVDVVRRCRRVVGYAGLEEGVFYVSLCMRVCVYWSEPNVGDH